MKFHTTLFAITVAVAALSAANVATARPGMGPDMGMRGGQGPEAAASVATRLAAGKAALKISADQDAAWAKYAGVMTQLAQAHDAMRTQMQAQVRDGKVPSAEEAAKQRDAMIKLRTEHQAQRAVAVRDLYAVLTPEQRAIAEDYLQGHRGHRMAGHMGGHMGGQGRHGDGGMGGR